MVEDWTQSGTSLSTDSGYSGAINPTTGVFNLSKPSLPGGGGVCPDDTRSGTVAPDGRTLTGMETIHPDATPTLCLVGIGWTFTGSLCGGGLLEPGEACDDGNADDGDGCSASCEIEPCYECSGEPSVCSPSTVGAPCDDGDPCTTATECDGAGSCLATVTLDCGDGSFCTIDSCHPQNGCVNEPDVRSCRTADKSVLLIVDKADDADKLVWKWIRGESTSQAEFGNPRSTAAYELCLFAGTASTVIGEALVGPDAQKWQTIGAKGYKYKDPAGAQNGIRKIVLKGNDDDRAKIVLKGKGANLPDPEPPLTLPVTTQLRNTDTNVCWDATFTAEKLNRAGKFKALHASSP